MTSSVGWWARSPPAVPSSSSPRTGRSPMGYDAGAPGRWPPRRCCVGWSGACSPADQLARRKVSDCTPSVWGRRRSTSARAELQEVSDADRLRPLRGARSGVRRLRRHSDARRATGRRRDRPERAPRSGSAGRQRARAAAAAATPSRPSHRLSGDAVWPVTGRPGTARPTRWTTSPLGSAVDGGFAPLAGARIACQRLVRHLVLHRGGRGRPPPNLLAERSELPLSSARSRGPTHLGLEETQRRLEAAGAQVEGARQRRQATQAQLNRTIAAAYRVGASEQLLNLVTTDNPKIVLDRADSLARLGHDEGNQVAAAHTAERELSVAETAVAGELASARRLDAGLAAKKAEVEATWRQQQQLLAQLQDDQLAALAAAQDRAEQAAASAASWSSW